MFTTSSVAAFVAAVAILAAQPSSQGTALGGVDMVFCCRSQYGGYEAIYGNNCYDWYCTSDPISNAPHEPIDVNACCAAEYNVPGATANCPGTTPWDWECVGP
ncbi:hypothetical protein GGI35DRAFT_462207 [Trichoderma velutinum]